MNKNDGGPAFPVGDHKETAPTYGMTLRDWFAGQAMKSLIRDTDWEQSELVMNAYLIADAMLAERAKP